MPSQVNNYQCPACTGPLHYEGTTGKLQCEYCDSAFEVEEIERLYAGQEEKAKAAYAEAAAKGEGFDEGELQSWGKDGEGMKTYSCPSCGAELVCETTTAATSCPYCGNPTVVPGQFADTMKPDYIIPFKLDKAAAKEGLLKHYKGKCLLPKNFVSSNRIDDITGVYVPFWLFDGSADAQAEYEASSSTVRIEGNYEVKRTRHYRVRRRGTASFTRIPIDSSSKTNNDYMDSIEPFDYGDLRDFSTAYLPGYLADRYDEDIETVAPRADTRMVNTTFNLLRSTVTGYDSVSVTGKNINLKRGSVKYAVFPVWMLSTSYEGKVYTFMMNGQTGKMVGDLPVSWKKFWFYMLAFFASFAALISVLQLCMFEDFSWEISLGPALLIAVFICMALKAAMKSVHTAITADKYVNEGGLKLSVKEDIFTHETVSRVEINHKRAK